MIGWRLKGYMGVLGASWGARDFDVFREKGHKQP